jgi:hypothetical protein
VILLAWAGACLAPPVPDPPPPPPKVGKEHLARAEKAVKAELERLKGTSGTLTRITSDPLARSLPGHVCFFVLFRQYPVARMPPPGLRASNLFVYGPEGKVHVLSRPADLEKFFKGRLGPAMNDEGMKDAARAYLALSQQLRQDGFYKFALEDDATKVARNREGNKVVTAKVVVKAGGNGLINARLIFNDKGKMTGVSEDAKLTPGPRPRCQATLLLHPDPEVRAMALDNLLLMGRAAKGYLDEQRAKASPKLRAAIDAVWKRIVARDRD